MLRARATLTRAAANHAARHVRPEGGDLIFAPEALEVGQTDTEGRVFAAAVQWIGGAGYRPRYEALLDAARALRQGQARTLGGVMMLPEAGGGARLMREVAATQGPVPAPSIKGAVLWDGRWSLSRTAPEVPAAPCHIAALGEAGLAQVPGWRTAGLPRASLLATPAIWDGGVLIAAPLAGMPRDWQANLSPSFESFILSH
jgi:tRNA(Ile)-lysidine synthase